MKISDGKGNSLKIIWKELKIIDWIVLILMPIIAIAIAIILFIAGYLSNNFTLKVILYIGIVFDFLLIGPGLIWGGLMVAAINSNNRVFKRLKKKNKQKNNKLNSKFFK